jgi:hypothetical protein
MGLAVSPSTVREFSKKCAKILVNFANAESLKDALFGLDSDVRKAFKLKIFDPEIQFETCKHSIKEAQQRLIKLFDELQVDSTLCKSETIAKYIADYAQLCSYQPIINPHNKNQTEIFRSLSEKENNLYQAALAFLIFQYVMNKARKPIIKCQLPNCRLYFAAERNTARYCSQKHKMSQFRIVKKLAAMMKRPKRRASLYSTDKYKHKKIKPSSEASPT